MHVRIAAPLSIGRLPNVTKLFGLTGASAGIAPGRADKFHMPRLPQAPAGVGREQGARPTVEDFRQGRASLPGPQVRYGPSPTNYEEVEFLLDPSGLGRSPNLLNSTTWNGYHRR
jgi:hypothetical protein